MDNKKKVKKSEAKKLQKSFWIRMVGLRLSVKKKSKRQTSLRGLEKLSNTAKDRACVRLLSKQWFAERLQAFMKKGVKV